MELSEYFEQARGVGVLATTDAKGRVNAAIYARPHFLDRDDEGVCAFVMSDRASHDNVKENPSASYLFIEVGEEYVGKRLSLTMIREETDPEKIKAVRRRSIPRISEDGGTKYLVHFHIDDVRPLIGAE
jgi:flavin reductase (DIM6/NTAB) family NADH-FMN oxidoreductase RutF